MPQALNKKFFLTLAITFITIGHIMLMLQNYKAIYEGISIGIPFDIIYGTLFSFSTSFTSLGLIVFLTNVILMSYLVASIVTLYKIEKKILSHSHKLGWTTMLAVIGSHCASCGSVILSSVFGATLATILPLGGVEFGILSVLILLYSSYNITKKLINPYVC